MLSRCALPGGILLLLAAISVPGLSAPWLPVDAAVGPGPPALPDQCADSAADEGPEADLDTSETFLLQVVFEVQSDATVPAQLKHKANSSLPTRTSSDMSGPTKAVRNHSSGTSGGKRRVQGAGSSSTTSAADRIFKGEAPRAQGAADPPLLSIEETRKIRELRGDKRASVDFARELLNTSTRAAEPQAQKRQISKRVLIILEMVPAGSLLGLDRLYLCDGCPLDSGDGAECGKHCYLGFIKLLISVMAFLQTHRLMPVALIWWFVDAGVVIDNCVRAQSSIHALGMHASFQEPSIDEARKLSLAAAGQFGLELALFLPALFALLVGADPESGFHRRIHSAIEGLRQPQGVSEAAIESATSTTLYEAGKTSSDNDEVCSICCDVFQERDRLRVLPCKHRFHAACIDRWLCRNSLCPLCKGDITCKGQQQDEQLAWYQTSFHDISSRISFSVPEEALLPWP